MTIYKQLLHAAQHGGKWSVDLVKKSLRVNGKYLIKEGHYEGNLGVKKTDDVWNKIQELYAVYKTSVPDVDEERRCYFKALPDEKLTIAQQIDGIPREEARAALEGYLLLQILNGYEWPFGNKYFGKGEDQDLTLLKLWF